MKGNFAILEGNLTWVLGQKMHIFPGVNGRKDFQIAEKTDLR